MCIEYNTDTHKNKFQNPYVTQPRQIFTIIQYNKAMKNHICLINLLHQNSTGCETTYKIYHLLEAHQGFTKHMNGRNMDLYTSMVIKCGTSDYYFIRAAISPKLKAFLFFESETYHPTQIAENSVSY